MKKVFFSFIIPVYNAERYLRECIKSILGQTYGNLELILVDDGSNDSSGIICDEFANTDSRVRVIHKYNEGPGMARNVGIDCASGEFIIFCDADDFYDDPDFLKTIYLKITSDTDVVVFNYANLYGSKIECSRRCILNLEGSYNDGKEYIKKALRTRYDYWWFPWVYAFRSSLLKPGNIKFPKEKMSEDKATIYKILLCAGRVNVIGTPFYIYRKETGQNCTSIKSYDTLSGIVGIAERSIRDVMSRDDLDNDLKQLLCNNFALEYFIAIIQADALSRTDFEKLIVFLKQNMQILNYVISKKQLVARRIMQIVGLKNTIKLLGMRKKIKESLKKLHK